MAKVLLSLATKNSLNWHCELPKFRMSFAASDGPEFDYPDQEASHVFLEEVEQ
jgi:hypothetical protein